MLASRVLLVDDESGPRFGIRRYLKSHGFDVDEADDCATAKEKYKTFRPDVSVIDFRLPDGDALELLRFFRTIDEAPVIVLTAYASIDAAVEAVKLGAEQFFTKPVELEALLAVIKRLLENRRTRNQLTARQKSVQARERIDPFLGTSGAITELRQRVDAALRADSPVLIRGETGTGKTVLARWIHQNSRRADGAFVDLNCGGLSREFLESELFGHEKGAFTGAAAAKDGLLDVAHRGTVFLDEIGDMHSQVQAALLKVLEEKRFRRLGDVKDRLVDVRLIAATHQPLGHLVDQGQFRRDLYFRISTLELVVPPLRERREDIAALARRLLTDLARDLGMPAPQIDSSVEERLRSYDWPGNLRELKNVLERALLQRSDGLIKAGDLLFQQNGGADRRSGGGLAFTGTLDDLEREYLIQVSAEESGQIERMSERLGISRSAVYYKLRKHRIGGSKIKK